MLCHYFSISFHYDGQVTNKQDQKNTSRHLNLDQLWDELTKLMTFPKMRENFARCHAAVAMSTALAAPFLHGKTVRRRFHIPIRAVI